MPIGNTTLIDYGIQNCESEYTAHVCPLVGRVYVFATTEGQNLVDNGHYTWRPVWTRLPNGDLCETARGYPIPWDHWDDLEWFDIPQDLRNTWNRVARASSSEKGRWAETVCRTMRERGIITTGIVTSQATDVAQQIRGIDMETRIPTYQVKYDERGGHRELGGTGNLFLQVAECNPLRAH